MANPEQLERLKRGVEGWNAWRDENRDVYLDLNSADLSSANLDGVKLRGANLRGAILLGANLRGAKLYFADLRDARFDAAHLQSTDLRNADLGKANLNRAFLTNANLSGADLFGTDLTNASLLRARLTNAILSGADLTNASLPGAYLHDAIVEHAVFARVDLREVKGLAKMKHVGPSFVELHTIQLPQDGSALHFLRGTGVPDEWIDFWRTTMMHPIQYHSCFISYTCKDEMLAQRLHADLQGRGVRCWFALEDMKIGDKIRTRIDEAIHVHEKLLLLLSEHAMESDWVEDEVEIAFAKEREQNREVLFPVRLDERVMQASQAWAKKLRDTRHIGDFTHWTDPQAYRRALDRLLRDLKKADKRQNQEMKQ